MCKRKISTWSRKYLWVMKRSRKNCWTMQTKQKRLRYNAMPETKHAKYKRDVAKENQNKPDETGIQGRQYVIDDIKNETMQIWKDHWSKKILSMETCIESNETRKLYKVTAKSVCSWFREREKLDKRKWDELWARRICCHSNVIWHLLSGSMNRETLGNQKRGKENRL